MCCSVQCTLHSSVGKEFSSPVWNAFFSNENNLTVSQQTDKNIQFSVTTSECGVAMTFSLLFHVLFLTRHEFCIVEVSVFILKINQSDRWEVWEADTVDWWNTRLGPTLRQGLLDFSSDQENYWKQQSNLEKLKNSNISNFIESGWIFVEPSWKPILHDLTDKK